MQYNSKLRIVKPKKPEIGVWKTVEAKGRRKYQKEKPKHIRGELPAKSKRQTNVNDASQPKTSKQAKSGPKQNFRDQNRQWNYHHMSMPFPSHESPIPMPGGCFYSMPYFYSSCSYNSYMSFLPRYFCSYYITSKGPTINQPPSTNNDRFDNKNQSIQKKKHKVIKQVYHVKKDGRLSKNPDLTHDKEKPTVEETSASFVDQIVPNRYHTSKNIAEQKTKFGWGAR